VGVIFCTVNESVADFVIFSYWGFIAQLEVGGERYGFSKIDLQTIIYQEFLSNNGYYKNIAKFSEFNNFDCI